MPSCEHICRVRTPSRRLPHSLVRYDVSGVPTERIQDIIETDWNHLLQDKRVLNSPNYLRENGKPVVAIWGAQPFQSTLSAVCSISSSFPRVWLQWPQSHTRSSPRLDLLLQALDA